MAGALQVFPTRSLLGPALAGAGALAALALVAVLMPAATACAVPPGTPVPAPTNLDVEPPLWWTEIGPRAIASGGGCTPEAGKLQAFAYDPADPSVMFAGGGILPGVAAPPTQTGILRTTDGGTTWEHVATGLDPTVNALWRDPQAPYPVLAGTEMAGIFRSTDGGDTWTQVYSAASAQVTSFAPCGTRLCATARVGVLVSGDQGATWSVLAATAAPGSTMDCVGTKCLVGLTDGTLLHLNPGTGATSFSNLFTTPVAAISINRFDPNNAAVAALGVYIVGPAYFLTSDGGTTWRVAAFVGGQPHHLAFSKTIPGTLYIGGGLTTGVWKDPNADDPLDTGAFTVSLSLGVDARFVVGQESGAVVVGSDQGLYRSTDDGATWASLNGNASTNILYNFAVAGNTIFTEAQDHGVPASFDGGATWKQSWSGSPCCEWGEVFINPDLPQYVYAWSFTLQAFGGWHTSDDGGLTFDLQPSPPADVGPFPTPNRIAWDRMRGKVYAAGRDGMYEGPPTGVGMVKNAWPFSNAAAVFVHPATGDIYVSGAGLQRSTDGGLTWTPVAVTAPAGCLAPTVTALAANPLDARFLAAGTDCPPSTRFVLASSSSGTSFAPMAAAPVTSGPNPVAGFQVNQVSFQPGSANLIVATYEGIYQTPDLGATWNDINANLDTRTITDIEWGPGKLYISTMGQGVLVTPYGPPLPPPGRVDPAFRLLDGDFGCQAVTITFGDASTPAGLATSWTWTFGDGSPPEAGATVTHTYVASGNYVVTMTASVGAASYTAVRIVPVALADPCPPRLEPLGFRAIVAGQTLEACTTGRAGRGGSLAYSVEDLPEKAAFDEATPCILWTPGEADIGFYPCILVRVRETPSGLSSGRCLTVRVLLRGSSTDADQDGVADEADVCPMVADWRQEDHDRDGLGDLCDPDAPQVDRAALEAARPPGERDTDRDGIADATDLCPLVPDHGQEDLDGDGAGDACDEDRDGDGVANLRDGCAWVPDPRQDCARPPAGATADTRARSPDGVASAAARPWAFGAAALGFALTFGVALVVARAVARRR